MSDSWPHWQLCADTGNRWEQTMSRTFPRGGPHMPSLFWNSPTCVLVPWQPNVETFVGLPSKFDLKTSFTSLNTVTSFLLLYLSSHLLWPSCLLSNYEWIIIVFVFPLYRAALKHACRRQLEVDCHKNRHHLHQHSPWTIGKSGWHGLPLVWVPLLLEHCWADSIRNQFISISTVWNKPATICILCSLPYLSPPRVPFLFLIQTVNKLLWHRPMNEACLTSWYIKLDGCSKMHCVTCVCVCVC